MFLRINRMVIGIFMVAALMYPEIVISASLDRILKLGVRKDCPPFSYTTPEGYYGNAIGPKGGYQGYSVELCMNIAEELKDRGAIDEYITVEISAKNRFKKLHSKL